MVFRLSWLAKLAARFPPFPSIGWWFCDFNHRLPPRARLLSSSQLLLFPQLLFSLLYFSPFLLCPHTLLPLARSTRPSAPLWAGLGLWDARMALGASASRLFCRIKETNKHRPPALAEAECSAVLHCRSGRRPAQRRRGAPNELSVHVSKKEKLVTKQVAAPPRCSPVRRDAQAKHHAVRIRRSEPAGRAVHACVLARACAVSLQGQASRRRTCSRSCSRNTRTVCVAKTYAYALLAIALALACTCCR